MKCDAGCAHNPTPQKAGIVRAEKNLTVGIDYLSGDWRLPGVCLVGEESEDEEAEQRNKKYGLNPAFGQKKTALSRRVHAIDIYGALRPSAQFHMGVTFHD